MDKYPDPHAQEWEFLKNMLAIPAEYYPDLRKFSVYHIQGVWWIKEQYNEVHSHDHKLGNFNDAIRELMKLTEHLIHTDIISPPPMIIEFSKMDAEIQRMMIEYFRLHGSL